ncbi:MAG: MlaD family protein [Limisphaerales bacterium]|jgi:ABC-type transporter Mla subunit MlaD|nr:MlaD family protein [Verrucomicrobiota bacterium]
MALNDLTPQLRTQMDKVEKWVGFFVIVASLIALGTISYYAYSTAVRKGWTKKKAPYFTLVSSADGLKVGDSVMLMGFKAGVITAIEPNAPGEYYNITVQFDIWEPYYGYLWNDSDVRLKSGLLGGKTLEVSKGGQSSLDIKISATYKEENGKFYVWQDPSGDEEEGKWSSEPIDKNFMGYFLFCYESTDVMKSANDLVNKVSEGLPGFLSLTNQISALLEESTKLMASANGTVQELEPIVQNVQLISSILTNQHGGFGEWVIPAEMNKELVETLGSVRGTVETSETNLVMLSKSLNETLVNLAQITGNLKEQVQANSYMLSSISSLVLDLDDLVQGLKRNWLLKGSFNPQTNAVPQSVLQPTLGGKK